MADDDFDFSEVTDESPGWAKNLRDKAEKALTKGREGTTEAERLRKENALLRSGLTFDDPDREAALLDLHKGDVTPESLRATAVKYGWAEPLPDTNAEHQAAADASAAGQAAQAQAVQQGAAQKSPGVITPADVKNRIGTHGPGWWTAFAEANPQAAEALKRGEEVSGIAL